MSNRLFDSPARIPVFFCLTLILSCTAAHDRAERVIAFDLSRLDENGLQGPPDGLRALHYEFCVPADSECVIEVTQIDSTLTVTEDSRGRARCGPNELLCLGNTHQPGYAGVLIRLANLPYVHRIEESFFEH